MPDSLSGWLASYRRSQLRLSLGESGSTAPFNRFRQQYRQSGMTRIDDLSGLKTDWMVDLESRAEEPMTPMHAEGSTHVDAGGGAVAMITGVKERLPTILLACCLVALVVLILLYRYDSQERDLDRYDDGQRQERVDKELADLRAQVKVNEQLIQAYGLQQAIKENPSGRPYHHP